MKIRGVVLLAVLACSLGSRHALAQRAGTNTVTMTPDSLYAEELPRLSLLAADFASLQELHQEATYALEQYRRYIGPAPPRVGIAALGTLKDPSRVSLARLRTNGIENIVTDWPPPPGSANAAEVPTLSERAARWYLRAYEKSNSRGTPQPGKTRLIPDWFESGLAGLCTPTHEQNRRLKWMLERMDRRIPFGRLFEMSRPVPAAAPAAPRGRKPTAAAVAAAARAAAASADSIKLFDVECMTLCRYIVQSEDDRFLGRFLELLLDGQPQLAALSTARNVLPRPDALEKRWADWMQADPAHPGANPPTAR